MNKKKILNIIGIPVKICLVLCMAYGIYTYFDQVFAIKDVDRAESFHNLPENSMDVIVLGSSHAQYSFIPSVFYQDTGLYSVVMGSACQPLEVSYQMLREILKTQKPDMVILETYTAMPLRKVCEADVCYVKAQYMMTGEEKYTTIDYLPEDKALSYYNEFINNHNNWRNVEKINELVLDFNKSEVQYIEGNMGYIEQLPELPIENYWYAEKYDNVLDVELDELDFESLNNIYDLCQENNIELMLYKTPIDNIDQENYSYLQKVWKWCDEREIPYLDMIALQDEIGFRMVSHSDSYHCNIVGANAITEKIGNYINDNYEFSHINYDALNEIYDNDAIHKAIDIYCYERNVYRALRRISGQDLTLIVKYEPGIIMEDRLKEQLINLGFGEDFSVDESYYAVIKNGEVIIETNGEPIECKNGDGFIQIADDIVINGEPLGCEGYLSLAVATNNLNDYCLKNVDINGYPWELGYDYFIKNN